MANVLFMGDAHIGHKNSLRWRPRFKTMEEYVATLDTNYRSKVTKRDIVYWMGDAIMDPAWLPFIAALPGKKILVMGNHDQEYVTTQELLSVFDDIAGMVKYKEFWLTHAPIHPEELRDKVNIHGHVHNATIYDCRYVNTSMENINYLPVSLHEIRTHIINNPERVFGK